MLTLTAPSTLQLTAREDEPTTISGLHVNDAHSGSLTITLTASSTLTLSSIAGLTFTVGDGAADHTMTFSGSLDNINAALTNITYTSSADFAGTGHVAYIISDAVETINGSFSVTVTAVNDAPVVVVTTANLSFTENQTPKVIDSELTVSDVDSADLTRATVTIAAGFQSGDTLTIDGSTSGFVVVGGHTMQFSYDGNTHELSLSGTATPADYQAVLRTVSFSNIGVDVANSTRTIEFQVDDGSAENHASQVATASITVGAVNTAPDTNAGSGSGLEGAASIAVSLSGSDLDGTVASFHISSLPANGTLYSDAELTTVLASGDSVAASGNAATVFFVPAANFNGSTSFQYAAVDNNAAQDATPATASITVGAVNTAPDTNAGSGSGLEGAASIAVSLSGSDLDGTVASFHISSLPANGTLYSDAELTTVLASGDSVAASGNAATVFFVPAANFNGSTSFQYAAVDNNAAQDATPATASITVGAVNTAPDTNAGSGSGLEGAASIAVSLSGSDLDGTVASFHISSLPANGTLYSDAELTTVLASGDSVAASGNAATVFFVPAANFNGSTSFQYAAVDNNAAQDATPATASITVGAVNTAPDTNAGSGSGLEGAASIAVSLSGSDLDGTVASFHISSLPANGTLYSDAELTTVLASGDSVAASGNAATVFFVPAANFNGSTSFQYAAVDNNAAQDATPATASITVGAVNDAPTVANVISDQFATQGSAFTFAFATTTFIDVDVGDTLTYAATLADGSALPSWLVFNAATRTFSGTAGNSDVGTISVKVTATDGSLASIFDTFDIVVGNTNDAPVIQNVGRTASVDENNSVLLAVPTALVTDADGDTLTMTVSVSHGTLTPSSAILDAIANHTLTSSDPDGSDGSLSITGSAAAITAAIQAGVNYAPNNNFNGSDSLGVLVTDGHGGTTAASVGITVTSGNDAPVATDDVLAAVAEDSGDADHQLCIAVGQRLRRVRPTRAARR